MTCPDCIYGIRMYIIIFIKKIPQKAIFLTVSLPTSCTWNFLKGIILSLLEFISSGQVGLSSFDATRFKAA